jgi:hypothetical protein
MVRISPITTGIEISQHLTMKGEPYGSPFFIVAAEIAEYAEISVYSAVNSPEPYCGVTRVTRCVSLFVTATKVQKMLPCVSGSTSMRS